MSKSSSPLLADQSMTLVAAMGRQREIGLRGAMPWHLPRDLQHFKQLTMGHTVLMGRKTWEALPFALPGRCNIVITRQSDYQPQQHTPLRGETVLLAHSLAEACERAGTGVLMVIGGAQLYALCLPWADALELTLIETTTEADTWFPAWDENEWREVSRLTHVADDNNPYDLHFVRLERRVVLPAARSG